MTITHAFPSKNPFDKKLDIMRLKPLCDLPDNIKKEIGQFVCEMGVVNLEKTPNYFKTEVTVGHNGILFCGIKPHEDHERDGRTLASPCLFELAARNKKTGHSISLRLSNTNHAPETLNVSVTDSRNIIIYSGVVAERVETAYRLFRDELTRIEFFSEPTLLSSDLDVA